VREILERYLTRAGFEVETAADGQAALDAHAKSPPDLIILDLMLPKVDGLEVFRRIRERDPDTPVIMLTARGEETDRVVGLRAGADDYVAKPFSPREIVFRVQAVLRRVRATTNGAVPDAPLIFGDVELHVSAREVKVAGQPVSLTPKEFDLLHFLAANPRQAFDRLRLLEELWDVAYEGDPSTVTVHVRRLRQKIEADPSEPRHLVTVWGAGYRLEP